MIDMARLYDAMQRCFGHLARGGGPVLVVGTYQYDDHLLVILVRPRGSATLCLATYNAKTDAFTDGRVDLAPEHAREAFAQRVRSSVPEPRKPLPPPLPI